jgi:NAD(P)-dependent dehydrogenase (short-subunit alcohol dehydrogenase family)
MDLNLSGKHILITGGSKGIGLACAQAFLAEGSRVSLVSRSEANLARARESLSAHGNDCVQTHAADLTQPASAQAALDAAIATFGPVDVLVNSAGAAKRTPAPELTPQAWHDAMQAKYFSYIQQAYKPHDEIPTKRCQGEGQRHLAIEIRVIALEDFVFLDVDDHVEIPRRAPLLARIAVSHGTKPPTVDHAGGNL